MPLYLTPTPKVMGTSNLARSLVFAEVFLKLVLS